MPGPKTNEHRPDQLPGTRAVLRYARVSAYKVREVLDLIRNKPVGEARDILRFVERDAALLVGKLLDSAVANATTNDEMIEDELYVSACFADEGTTIKRWRPRARGRATRIRKRTCHITVIVSRLPDEQLGRLRVRQAEEQASRRARRVAGARRAAAGGRGRRQSAAGELADEEEDEGIVDPQAEALASLEEEETPEELEEAEAKAEAMAETPAGQIAEVEEEQGIVDPQAEALAEAQAEEAAEEAQSSGEDAESSGEDAESKDE
jgi:large subunit ribosomal protein L22